MTANPEAIYNQACADIEKLALDHGITREQAAGLMIEALKPTLKELTKGERNEDFHSRPIKGSKVQA